MDNEQLLIDYLREKGSSKSSVTSYLHAYKKFSLWTVDHHIENEYISTPELLDYIASLRNRSLAQSTIQTYLNALSHYFEALIQAKVITQNPANYITIKTKQHRTLHAVLSREQLEGLYNNFEVKGKRKTKATAHLSSVRNKIAIGLMVFQGLDITSLSRLETKDINLLNGTVYINSSRTCAARTLALQAVQIIELDRYFTQTRRELQEHFKQLDSNLLLITGYAKYTDANKRLMRRLRKQEPILKSTDQIRASVIAHWLKHYNLREVQYMAGHKHIHSTESYQQNDTEGLKMDIDRLHPMNEV